MNDKQTALISVVIPTTGTRPHLLNEAIACVRGQSISTNEILIINNGKNEIENTWDDHRVKVLRIPCRAGVAQARNFGVSMALQPYVAFLDDDDLWEKNYLEKLMTVVNAQKPDAIIARLDRYDDGKISPFKNAHNNLNTDVLFVRNPGATGTSTTVRREAFLNVGGYDPELPPSEDKAMVLEMLLQNYHVVSAPHAQALMRFHPGERLSAPKSLLQGITRFLDKYKSIMTSKQQIFNQAKKARYTFEISGKLIDSLRWRPFQFIIFSNEMLEKCRNILQRIHSL